MIILENCGFLSIEGCMGLCFETVAERVFELGSVSAVGVSFGGRVLRQS